MHTGAKEVPTAYNAHVVLHLRYIVAYSVHAVQTPPSIRFKSEGNIVLMLGPSELFHNSLIINNKIKILETVSNRIKYLFASINNNII